VSFLVVALAGAFGAPMRYLIAAWMQHKTNGAFPWGTFIVNVSGSLLLGFITGMVLFHGFPNIPKLLIGTGFCGAYTTFSTFAFESVRLGEDGSLLEGLGNVVGSALAGLLGAGLGLMLAAAV